MSTHLTTHQPAQHLVMQGGIDQPLAVRETSSAARAAQAKALVEARYTVALARPRDLDVVRQKMLRECQRPRFADVARYRKPVGQGIEGPSIRFAEMAIRCMGNVTVENEVVFEDDEKRIVKVTVTDLEANVPYSQDVTLEKTVERRKVKQGDDVVRSRLNSKGEPVHIIRATDDEILNKQNALISKAVRTLGLRLVPGDLVEECMDEVIRVQRDRDAQDPDGERRRLLDAFATQGVSADQVKAYLGHDAGHLTPKELTELRAVYAALRDGETSWREVMDARDAPPPTGDAAPDPRAKPATRGNAGLKDRLAGAAAAAQPEPEPTSTANPDFPLADDERDLDLDAGDAPHAGGR